MFSFVHFTETDEKRLLKIRKKLSNDILYAVKKDGMTQYFPITENDEVLKKQSEGWGIIIVDKNFDAVYAPDISDRDNAAFLRKKRLLENCQIKQKSEKIRNKILAKIKKEEVRAKKMLRAVEYLYSLFNEKSEEINNYDLLEKYFRAEDDEVMHKALEIVIIKRNASTSYLQRNLNISFNRAADILELMEKRGIVSIPTDGCKRKILVGNSQIQ